MLKNTIKNEIREAVKEYIEELKKAPKEFTIEVEPTTDGKINLKGKFSIKF